jgi:hypothetical protein
MKSALKSNEVEDDFDFLIEDILLMKYSLLNNDDIDLNSNCGVVVIDDDEEDNLKYELRNVLLLRRSSLLSSLVFV